MKLDPKIIEQLLTLLGLILTILLTLLAPFALALVRRAVRHLEKMADVQLSEKQRQQIDWAVETAITYTEEQARKLVHERPDAPAMNGNAKRAAAREAARSLAPDKLSDLSDEQLEDVIDARVNRLRPALIASNYPAPLRSGISSLNPKIPRLDPLPSLEPPAISLVPEPDDQA